ncbi:hypothetical protein I4F81_008116 [Pyropia yezoensis]|uniref:Uncharacterized protein n=1 Tax=Pyropia yezoensis TaxID=2788 RepID=A0ACC3C709_PYRYE|nr:hypothetical protein I4F81_008116 [Neopyropia yezoensis]
MDALGVIAVGCITALGGGTVRDGLLLAVRPFWVAETEYLGLAAASAAAAFVALDETVDDHPVLWWTDAAGVGAFAGVRLPVWALGATDTAAVKGGGELAGEGGD